MPDLSAHVRRLIESLGSVEAIETLLALARAPTRSFSPAEVCALLHVTRSLETTLERLAVLNLVDARLGSEVRYRYAPTSAELEAAVRELSQEYDDKRLAVLEALRTTSPMEAFANAFRFRKKGKNDG